MPIKKAGLRKIRANFKGAQDRGVERAAGYVKDLEEQLAPYDASNQEPDHVHLNETIEVQGTPGSGKRKVVAGVGLPDARAAYNQYGTEYMAAVPYATTALAAIDVTAEVKKEVASLLKGSRA